MNIFFPNSPGLRFLCFFLAAACLVALAAGWQPLYTPETAGFLEGHFLQDPGYPFVVQAAVALAGPFYGTLLVILQQLAGILAAYSLCSFLRTRFELPDWLFCLIALFCLLPYLFPATGRIGNQIQSEGLTYPLFLFALRFLFMSLVDANPKAFAAYIYVFTLLILSSAQFFIFVPVTVFCLGYLAIATPQKKHAAALSLLFLSALLLSNIIIRANNYVSYGIFAPPPTTYQQLIIAPLYLADASDAEKLRTVEQRELFLHVLTRLKKKQAHHSSFPQLDAEEFAHYTQSFRCIRRTLYPLALAQYVRDHPQTESFEAAIALNQDFKEISFALIHAHFQDWFTLFARNVAMGARQFFLFAALCCIVCIGLVRRPGGFPLLAFAIVLLHCTNLIATSLMASPLYRYTFYTEICTEVLLILCVARVLGCGRIHHATNKGHA